MKKLLFKDILSVINCSYKIDGYETNNFITNVKPVSEANELSLVWIDTGKTNKEKLLKETEAKIIICDDSLSLNKHENPDKVLIQVKNPKLAMIKIINELYPQKPVFGIHPSAVIDKDAIISSKVYIGPNTIIGKAEIGEGTIIYGNSYIGNNVTIGNNVIIQFGCVIGTEGISTTKDDEGRWYQFPHIGGVIIEDNVSIDATCHVDRGTFSNTIIGEGTKISKYCYVGHNVTIGKNCIIIAYTLFCGSVSVGDDCWIGAKSTIRDQIKIGKRVFIGMGSLVVSNIPDGMEVMGSPARPVNEMKKILNKLKGFADEP